MVLQIFQRNVTVCPLRCFQLHAAALNIYGLCFNFSLFRNIEKIARNRNLFSRQIQCAAGYNIEHILRIKINVVCINREIRLGGIRISTQSYLYQSAVRIDFQHDRAVRLFKPGRRFLFHICHFNINTVDILLYLQCPALELDQFAFLGYFVLAFLAALRFISIDQCLYTGNCPGKYIRINLLCFFLRHDHITGLQVWQSVQLQLGYRAVIDAFQLIKNITANFLEFLHVFSIQQEISGDQIRIAQIRPDRHTNVLFIRLDIEAGDLVCGVLLAPDASIFRPGIRCTGKLR